MKKIILAALAASTLAAGTANALTVEVLPNTPSASYEVTDGHRVHVDSGAYINHKGGDAIVTDVGSLSQFQHLDPYNIKVDPSTIFGKPHTYSYGDIPKLEHVMTTDGTHYGRDVTVKIFKEKGWVVDNALGDHDYHNGKTQVGGNGDVYGHWEWTGKTYYFLFEKG